MLGLHGIGYDLHADDKMIDVHNSGIASRRNNCIQLFAHPDQPLLGDVLLDQLSHAALFRFTILAKSQPFVAGKQRILSKKYFCFHKHSASS